MVSAPSIALIVVGAVGAVGALASALGSAAMLPLLEKYAQDENMRQQLEQARAQGAGNGIGAWIMLVVSAFVIFGAVQMKGLKSYGLAIAASVVAVLPCVGPCCCLGIPFGIWSLVMLLKPEVKAGFEAAARGGAV